MLEQAIASGVCAMGGRVMLCGPLPTPAIAHLTVSMRADAGIVISASHNPYQDNGIKVFGDDGFKLPDEAESEIESFLADERLLGRRSTGPGIGRATRIEDAGGRYVVFLKQTFPRDLSLDGVHVVIDAAHGAAYKVAPLVFRELGARVTAIGVKPNGVNINKDAGALHPEHVRGEVVKRGAAIGIALDGDADRLIVVDEKGQIVDGDQVLAMCAARMTSDDTLRKKTVVATVMSNLGLEHALTRAGARLVRTQVGDRYVVEAMRAGGYNLGGEQSGHLVFLDHASTGDGILGGAAGPRPHAADRTAPQRARRALDAARAAGPRERDALGAAAARRHAPAGGPHHEDRQGARRRRSRARPVERHRTQAPHHARRPARGTDPGVGERARRRCPPRFRVLGELDLITACALQPRSRMFARLAAAATTLLAGALWTCDAVADEVAPPTDATPAAVAPAALALPPDLATPPTRWGNRMLAGHTFLYPVLHAGPFVTTYFGVAQGVYDESIPAVPIPGFRSTDLSLIGVTTTADLGIKITDWLGIEAQGRALAIIGTNGQSVLYGGGQINAGGFAAPIVRIARIESTGTQVSARALSSTSSTRGSRGAATSCSSKTAPPRTRSAPGSTTRAVRIYRWACSWRRSATCGASPAPPSRAGPASPAFRAPSTPRW